MCSEHALFILLAFITVPPIRSLQAICSTASPFSAQSASVSLLCTTRAMLRRVRKSLALQ
jgi:hypothetical protein